MYRGRFQLGQEVTIGVYCFDGNNAPVQPDDCPVAKVFNASGAIVFNKKISVQDKFNVTGLFQQNIFLGTAFAVGQYTVEYSYIVGGSFVGIDEDNFEIVAGGDTDGITEALHYYHRPQADYIIQQLNSGKLKKRRNPMF